MGKLWPLFSFHDFVQYSSYRYLKFSEGLSPETETEMYVKKYIYSSVKLFEHKNDVHLMSTVLLVQSRKLWILFRWNSWRVFSKLNQKHKTLFSMKVIRTPSKLFVQEDEFSLKNTNWQKKNNSVSRLLCFVKTRDTWRRGTFQSMKYPIYFNRACASCPTFLNH